MDDIKNQLSQMKAALTVSAEEDKPALKSIIKDLEDLINSFNAKSLPVPNSSNFINSEVPNDELDEFSRFQAEIAALEAGDSQSSETNDSSSNDPNGGCCSGSSVIAISGISQESGSKNISNELAALEGMKCLAPHEESWGQIGFYPAMISQVISSSTDSDDEDSEFDTMESIMVRVVFLQPVVKTQLLCPFYQEDRCRFEDGGCRFSHGEIVPLSKLREYSDPDYSKIIPEARVLAKHMDNLWYKATVTRLTNDGNCEVKFDKEEELYEIAVHETCPLTSDNLTETMSDSEDSISGENDMNSSDTIPDLMSSDDILKVKATEALGDWEKYTKGFGSKIMMQMGYIMGSGLGRKAEGRIIPVDAVMVPQGMSLDKYMNLKEKAGGNANLYSVEKRLKKAQRKHEAQEEKLASKKHKSHSVFDFMNNKLCIRKQKHQPSKNETLMINKQTANNLKKNMLQVGEDMKKVNKDIRKVKESMKRIEGRDAVTHSKMKEKLESLQTERDKLFKMENSIVNEQKHRSDKKKLLEF